MALELRPGWTSALRRLAEQGVARAETALEVLAVELEDTARQRASNGIHAYGTPTPARPGEGPAEISGTLKESIGHTRPIKDLLGWEMKVGPRVGFTPPYGRRQTSADQYGYFLETGLRNGTTYPWLKPSVDLVRPKSGTILARVLNETPWATF